MNGVNVRRKKYGACSLAVRIQKKRKDATKTALDCFWSSAV